jgi:hypothetical protein
LTAGAVKKLQSHIVKRDMKPMLFVTL